MTNALTLLVFSACLGACAPGIPEIPPPAPSVTRREALAASRAYISMIWRGSLRNVRHGTDGDGIRTDTPDASAAGYDAGAWWKPGMRSIGMPYKWGGFDTPRQFSERLKADAANGGLPSWEDLRTGDILIAPGRHVLLFIQWEGTEKSRFLGSEAGPLPAWKCSEHVFSRAMLENSGYRPMRYRGMRD